MGRLRFVLGILAALFVATPVMAEVLTLDTARPADSDAAAALNTIAIEQFGGTDGPAASIAIGDALRSASDPDGPYFKILPSGFGGSPDGVLRGAISRSSREQGGYDKTVEECVEKDDDGKCVRKEKRKVRCWTNVFTLDPQIRLIGANGALLYSDEQPVEKQVGQCADQRKPDREPILRELVARLADRTRHALAPAFARQDIRVMESRKGLPGDTSNAFKGAVRLTKGDQDAACGAWKSMESAAPNQPSIVFNLGLCAERAGDYDTARTYYGRVLSMGEGVDYAQAGLARLNDRDRADMQLANHRGH